MTDEPILPDPRYSAFGSAAEGNGSFPTPADDPVAASQSLPVVGPHGQHDIGTTGVPSRPQSGLGMLLRRVAGTAILIFFVLFKWIKIGLIFLTKLKFAGTAISMVVSVGAYALIWGLPFAIGFVGLMFIHELGHAIQIKREGIKSSPIVFLPFVGAVIAMKEMPRNALVEARVAFAGPLVGSLGALVVYWAALQYDSDFLQALAFTGFFLNLFNLVPLSPLDGGRIVAALSPALWFAGIAIMVGAMFLWPNPILIIIVILGVLESWNRWKSRHDAGAYYRSVTPKQRMVIGLSYAGLAITLAVLMTASHLPREI